MMSIEGLIVLTKPIAKSISGADEVAKLCSGVRTSGADFFKTVVLRKLSGGVYCVSTK